MIEVRCWDMEESIVKRATSKSLRVLLAAAALLVVLLTGCFSPLQTEETGLVIPLGSIFALEPMPGYGYAMDIYIYQASDVSLVDDVIEISEGAVPVRIGGQPFYRINTADWPMFEGGGTSVVAREAIVPAISPGGPYVLHIRLVVNGEETESEYATIGDDGSGSLSLVTFFVEAGKTTVLPDSSIRYAMPN